MQTDLEIRDRAWASLRVHAHALLVGGYRRLPAATFTSSSEPEITGELCRAISEFMATDDAPDWVEFYALRDDPKVNVPGRLGESRPRIDIEFERVQRGNRPLFRFEAKRLGQGHPLSAYLGEPGMGAFLDGHYPVAHSEAGMLGYCQTRDVTYWTDALRAELQSDPTAHRQVAGNCAAAHPLAAGLETWRTVHFSAEAGVITIWHSFLRFW
jgi:hypothetical protein